MELLLFILQLKKEGNSVLYTFMIHVYTIYSLECLVWLLKHGSGNVHLSAIDGMSAVHAAAQAGHVRCLQVLFEHGVSPRMRSNEGATPTHYAAASGRVSEYNVVNCDDCTTG